MAIQYDMAAGQLGQGGWEEDRMRGGAMALKGGVSRERQGLRVNNALMSIRR